MFAHSFWIIVQAVRGYHHVAWSGLIRMFGQMAVSAVYSALLTPLAHAMLGGVQRTLMIVPVTRRRTRR